ncbi:MAG: PIG-L family deacetylase [Desulfobulbaceae bacterium]|nr:PIG-L family deacetylase [Desulfobulbaceae bacterium]
MANILVVAPHPDDETLGCGGTLLKHKENGDEIYWCIVTSMKGVPIFSEEQIMAREQQIQKVSDSYGFQQVKRLNFPTMSLDTIPMIDLVGSFSRVINKIEPNILFLPFCEDIHSDHRVTFNAAFSCTKSFRYPFLKKVLMMEIPSETEFAPAMRSTAFTPNCFVDITDFLEEKITIMEHYVTEISSLPFPRSSAAIKALATIRGTIAGCLYAESFMLLKEIL